MQALAGLLALSGWMTTAAGALIIIDDGAMAIKLEVATSH